jgi:tRNA dimethylallyltransferase
MLREGLLEEIEHLESLGFDRRLNALNTVGYAEGFAYRAGEISWKEMDRLFKQNSRRYAKRQLTWFRADKRINWITMTSDRNIDQVAAEIAARFETSLKFRETP